MKAFLGLAFASLQFVRGDGRIFFFLTHEEISTIKEIEMKALETYFRTKTGDFPQECLTALEVVLSHIPSMSLSSSSSIRSHIFRYLVLASCSLVLHAQELFVLGARG